MNLYKKNYIKLGVIFIVLVALAGCATRTAYFKLDSSLQKEMRNFNGVQYLPLTKLCDSLNIGCRWETFIRTATLENGSSRIVLRADSDRILVNGVEKRLERPVVFTGGTIFVPVSFARQDLGPLLKTAKAEPLAPGRESQKQFTIRTIVLDPGHGGKDVGAMGKRIRLREKDGVLMLARKMKKVLEDAGVRVIMTRDNDTFIPLPKRAEIANRNNADLFVSVHINASRSRLLRGFECYYLSNATDDNARALEAFEDSSLKMGEDAVAEHSNRLDKALWDMTLTENRRESAELAGLICDSIDNSFTIRNRGIRSARFYVLKHTRMPAVLVECGYISNRYEEMKLSDPAFLDRIANAVAQGILRYRQEYERTEAFTR